MSASRYPQLEWREVTSGHWEREIDEAEQFYTYLAKSYEGSGRMFFAITGFVSLTIKLQDGLSLSSMSTRVAEALRNAWLQLRHDHPAIASKTAYDPFRNKWIKSYSTLKADASPDQNSPWLLETFIEVDSSMTGIEWCNSDPAAPELPTLFIISSESSERSTDTIQRDLVIRSPHNVVDGVGTLHLLDNLIANVKQCLEQPSMWKSPPSSQEATKLSPPLRIAAAMPPILTLDQQARLQKIVARNESLRQGCELLTVPFKDGAVAPGQHQRVAIEMAELDTKKLLRICRSLGVTVTHAFHTAIACVLRDLLKPSEVNRQVRYITYCLINLRPKCKGNYRTAKYAASVYHAVSGESLALDLTVPSIRDKAQGLCDTRSEFLSLLERVRAFYESARDSPDILALAPSFWSMATPHLVDPASQPHQTPIPEPNMSPSVSLSSMGIIDNIVSPHYGPIKVDRPWVTGEELGTGIGVFLGTWEGKLQLSAAYNDAWHDRAEIESFLKNCQEVVQHGLNMNE